MTGQKLTILTSYHASYHYCWSRGGQSHWNSSPIPCIYVSDSVRYSVFYSDHPLSYIQDSLLHWHWTHLCVCSRHSAAFLVHSLLICAVSVHLSPSFQWQLAPLL